MRYSYRMAGWAALVVAFSAGVACAGPLERNAASKADGNFTGRETVRRGAVNRAYSYAPTTPAAAPQAATENSESNSTKTFTNEKTTEKPTAARTEGSTRSFSYSTPPSAGTNWSYRQRSPNRNIFRADHKALGEY